MLVSTYVRSLAIRDQPIEPHTLRVQSNAIYLDAVVGARTATEPYFDQMRYEELRAKAVANDREQQESLLLRRRALLQREEANEIHDPRVEEIVLAESRRKLQIRFDGPLPVGEWEVRVASELIGSIDGGRSDVVLEFDQAWSREQPPMVRELVFVDKLTGIRLVHPPE